MPIDHTELKTRLMAETEAEIDEWLASEAVHEKMKLSEIEDEIEKFYTRTRERILKAMVEVQVAEVEKCPHCGGKLRRKGTKRKQMVTTQGQTDLEREYYYCPTCQQGIFPPG
jgi:uncharacterized protein with PIN domain